MAIRERLSGNEAVANAMRQIDPDVMPAFPITPSTELPQYFSGYVANGKVDTEFIPVESEHSAMSAAIGAEAAGARTLTATSSCGLAYMWELLYVAASDRLPIAMAVGTGHCRDRSISIATIRMLWGRGTPDGSSSMQRITRRLMIILCRLTGSRSIRM